MSITYFCYFIFYVKSMKNTRIQGFSFIEILIIITILALISVVAYTSFWVRQDNAVNTKIQSEISTLANALLSYKQENSELPQPQWNRNFFAEDTSYVHDYEDIETYGVHGFITHNTLAKKYIDIIPVDPRTGSFYGYGKTKWTDEESEMYEIAWVTFDWDTYSSFVIWDYTAENGPFNLIREYNGPNFVYDRSQNNFPYNPLERILTAKIDDFSGNILINNNSYSSEEVLSYQLKSWDTIEVEQNAIAELYYSDGSRSILWDTSRPTILTLEKMEFSQENNLITDIKLVLESWMIWNKAASLDEESGFEIYTTDSTAAVRWTVFWVQKNDNNSSVVVKKWTVAVNQIDTSAISDNSTLKTYIKNNDVIPSSPITSLWWVIDFDSTTQESMIKVENNEPEKWASIWTNIISNTWALEDIPTEIKDEVINNYPIINNNIQVALHSYNYDATSVSISLNITEKVFKHADFMLINGTDKLEINKSLPYTQSWRIITYTFDKNSWLIEEATYNANNYINRANLWNSITNFVWNINSATVWGWAWISIWVTEYNNLWTWNPESLEQWNNTYLNENNTPEEISLLHFINTTHATTTLNLLEYINKKVGDWEEQITIQLWKVARNWKIRLTNKVRLTIINEKSYENNNDEDEKITEDDIIEEKENNIAKDRGNTGCDWFLFTNINNQDKCADADDDLVTDNWNLVAFAPYDDAGDIKMYNSWSTISVLSDQILNNNCIPKLWYNTWLYFYDSNCIFTSLSINHPWWYSISDIKNLLWIWSFINDTEYRTKFQSVFNYDITNSYFNWLPNGFWNWEKWIYLDNYQDNDYIKYNNLDISWKVFILEMNVRIWDLDKRYLVHSGNNFKLFVENGYLKINNWTNTSSNYPELLLNLNQFNNIKIKNDWSFTYLKVWTNNWKKLAITASPENHTYIWTLNISTNYYYQINSIIDFIKIYK